MDLPVKPFRAPVAPRKSSAIDPRVLFALYSDNKELKGALLNGLVAAGIIAGSVIAKTGFTYATLALIVLAIFGLALVDTWKAIFLFLVYLTLEGMYKYTSNFNQVVYVMAPLLSAAIFVGWRIRARNEAEQKEARDKSNPDIKDSLFQTKQGINGVGLPKMASVVLALIALSLLQAANPASPNLIGALNGGFVWYIGPMSFFFITYYALGHRREVMGFVYTVLVSGFVVTAYAVVQFYLGEEWVNSHVPGMQYMANFSYVVGEGTKAESGAFRPASTFSLAGGYTGVSCLAVLAALTVAVMPRMATWRRTLALLSVSVLTMGVLVSGVRSTLLILLVVIPTMLLASVRRFEDAIRIYLMTFLIGALLAASFVVANNAASGKLSKRFGTVLSGNPLNTYTKNRGTSLLLIPQSIAVRPFGVGIRRTTRGGAQRLTGANEEGLDVLENRETQWNAIQVDLGVFGLISVAILFVGLLVQGAIICRKMADPNLRALGGLMYTIILFHVIASFGSAVLQSNYIFWCASGILFALPRIAAAEKKLLAKSSAGGSETDTPPTGHPVSA